MKKAALTLFLFLALLCLSACNVRTDYSVEEAFGLMNEAIANYLAADSVLMTFDGSYVSDNYNTVDHLEVRMRNIGDADFFSRVTMAVSENDVPMTATYYYYDGFIYALRNQNDQTEQVKYVFSAAEYITLYTSFIKSTIDYDNTRDRQIQMDRKQIVVTFELAFSKVESTFFVNSVIEDGAVNFATVSIVFSQNLQLLSFEVQYDARINGIIGTQTYTVVIDSLNRYVVIPEISGKADYTEVDPDAETN